MPPILEIENVTVYRGRTRVFENLSLEIPLGCHAVILGPNGAGKSTLLKLLSRELYPVAQAGSSVRVFGKEDWNVWELRSRLGIVSDDLQTSYSGNASGRNVILSGLYSSIGVWPNQTFDCSDQDRANEIMEQLGVADLERKSFGAMSTGERRRFLLGRALISDPEALVLDEPTGGLDLKAVFQYLDIVRGLMRAGKTVILVTHHIHEIPPEMDRVLLLKEGKVIADSGKESVLTSDRLSSLFEVPIQLLRANGFYQAVPGHRVENRLVPPKNMRETI
jgi:iron complex transport system ATP-binding protein